MFQGVNRIFVSAKEYDSLFLNRRDAKNSFKNVFIWGIFRNEFKIFWLPGYSSGCGQGKSCCCRSWGKHCHGQHTWFNVADRRCKQCQISLFVSISSAGSILRVWLFLYVNILYYLIASQMFQSFLFVLVSMDLEKFIWYGCCWNLFVWDRKAFLMGYVLAVCNVDLGVGAWIYYLFERGLNWMS